MAIFIFCRDYTNPHLPVNPSAIEGVTQVVFIFKLVHFFRIHWNLIINLIQPIVGPDGKKKESESNVLLASIENPQYAVTADVFHTVCIGILVF